MQLFHLVEDAVAIVRMPKGIFRQAKMYHRGDRLFVGYGAGFLRITAKFGDSWGTSHPEIRVMEFECPNATGASEPRYEAPPAAVPIRSARAA
jgi:hypothetical protein